MRNVFVRTDFRVLHRRAESVGRSDRPANRGFRPLVVVQQREQRGLTLRQASLSIRDIGSALGLSRGTVQRELDAADPASLPDTIVGADGKERPASKSTVSVDDSEATVPNGTVDPETSVTVDDSEVRAASARSVRQDSGRAADPPPRAAARGDRQRNAEDGVGAEPALVLACRRARAWLRRRRSGRTRRARRRLRRAPR